MPSARDLCKEKSIALSDHAERVYDIIQQIPTGKVSTYALVARAIKSSPRAVGQALRKNPLPPIIPCHRVIRSNRKLGGFFGKTNPQSKEIKHKRKLLMEEGVEFEKDMICEACVYTFSN